jgi:small subunit ribosomal protein S18
MNENMAAINTNLLKEKTSTNFLKLSETPRNQNNLQKKNNESFNKKSNSKSTGSRSDSKKSTNSFTLRRRKVLSVSQLLVRVQKQKQRQLNQKKRQKPVKPIIPPKSLIIILKDKPEKAVYNRRIIDYKHCGLLQRYIGLGGKILPRRQTKLTAKQQRYVAKTIKSARIMGLLPFVTKERGFFR